MKIMRAIFVLWMIQLWCASSRERTELYICLSLNAQEEVGRKPNSIIPCLWRDTVNSKRSMRKSNIAHFNSYEGFYITFWETKREIFSSLIARFCWTDTKLGPPCRDNQIAECYIRYGTYIQRRFIQLLSWVTAVIFVTWKPWNRDVTGLRHRIWSK